VITIKTYGNLAEAGFASSLLEAHGIGAFLADEYTFTLTPGAAICPIRLQVDEADAEQAKLILDGKIEAIKPDPERD
jgi:putative signal transducing protein